VLDKNQQMIFMISELFCYQLFV